MPTEVSYFLEDTLHEAKKKKETHLQCSPIAIPSDQPPGFPLPQRMPFSALAMPLEALRADTFISLHLVFNHQAQIELSKEISSKLVLTSLSRKVTIS